MAHPTFGLLRKLFDRAVLIGVCSTEVLPSISSNTTSSDASRRYIHITPYQSMLQGGGGVPLLLVGLRRA